MKKVLAASFTALFVLTCQSPMMTIEDPPEEVEPYDGPASSGILPQYDPETYDAGEIVIDAGVIEIDMRCCMTHFQISDQEPADSTGVLKGESLAFGDGIPLSRTDAGWQASLCFPVGASATYWYSFTLDAGFVDAGVEINREDGGEEIIIVHETQTVIRASDGEPGFDTADGRRNIYHSVNSCDGLDGSVP